MKKRSTYISWHSISLGILGLVFGYVFALSAQGNIAFMGAVKCPYHHMDVSQPS